MSASTIPLVVPYFVDPVEALGEAALFYDYNACAHMDLPSDFIFQGALVQDRSLDFSSLSESYTRFIVVASQRWSAVCRKCAPLYIRVITHSQSFTAKVAVLGQLTV